MTTRTEIYYSVYFKKVYGSDSIIIELPENIKINELYNFIKPFIELKYNITDNFHIIEAGTEHAENALPISLNEDIKFFERYSKKHAAFYIKTGGTPPST